MSAFVMVISDGPMSETALRAYRDARGRVAAHLPRASIDEMCAPGLAASKFSLAHSRASGFGRDAATGSWLCCLGNPTGRGVSSYAPDELPGELLSSYLKIGRAAITALNAPFAAVIFDGRDSSIHVAADRVGLQHLYFRRLDNAFLFSTSSLALAAAAPVRLDADAVATYFQFGDLLGAATFFAEIEKVPARTWMTISGGRETREEYWRPPVGEGGAGLADWGAELAAAGIEYAQSALSRGAPTTVELTGGLDSRFNLACALRSGRAFSAFTIGDVSPADLAVARRLQAERGFAHHVASPLAELAETFENDLRLLHRLTDGQTDMLNVIASPSANRQASALRVQSVTGIGGELLRAALYRSRGAGPTDVDVARLINWQMCLGATYHPEVFSPAVADRGRERISRAVGAALRESEGDEALRRLDRFYLFALTQSCSGRSMTFNNYFYRQAAPYLSNRMLDAAFRMPARLKRSSLVLRAAVESADKEISRPCLANGQPAHPLGLLDLSAALRGEAAFGLRVLRKALAKAAGRPPARGGAGVRALVDAKLAALCERMLRPDRMASAALYNEDALAAFVCRNIERGLPDRGLLGLMLSMEMTFEYAGANIRIP